MVASAGPAGRRNVNNALHAKPDRVMDVVPLVVAACGLLASLATITLFWIAHGFSFPCVEAL